MATFNNNESGSSVRTKINAVLQHADGTAGELVINEAGADVDFRVESDTNANALFLDGASGNVGIGRTPIYNLDVQSAGNAIARLRSASGSSSGYYVTQPNSDTTMFALSDKALTTGGTIGTIASLFTGSSIPLIFEVSAAERMRIDASGNVGIGVVPSAWIGAGGWMDFPSNGFLGNATSYSGNAMSIGVNAYYGSGAWRYKTTGLHASYQTQASGQNQWFTAPSGTAGAAITFTQAMTLDASGNLGVGTASPNAASIIDAQSTTKGVRFPNMTTDQKNAIANVAGNVIFDTTLGKLCVNTGSGWQTITSA